MEVNSQRIFRALRVLWSRMGPMRFYVLGAVALVLVLATLGVRHLVSSGRHVPTPPVHDSGADASSVSHDHVIAITEIGSTETRGRNGQKNVAVKIGVAPRPKTKKGEVEIRVLFFDVTPGGEMRPTEAEVNYEWLTRNRDWTDPSPKYLVATYLGAGSSLKSAERLRYGGFVVRIYFDGQLQAETSEPKELVAALRSGITSPSPRPPLHSEAAIAVETPSPNRIHPPALASEPRNMAPPAIPETPSPPSGSREPR
jgi:hypothetical protein